MLLDNLKPIKIKEEDFTAIQKDGEIKISDFRDGSGSKYIATVSDGSFVLEENSRYKYLASYISQKDQIVGLKFQRFKKIKNGQLLANPENFSIPLKQADKLTDFLRFLSEANLGTLTSGKFQIVDSLELDPDLYSKLVSLSSDEVGKNILLKLVEDGYLDLGLDLPELIKKGLSKNKIDEKLESLNNFEKLILQEGVKEVLDIQTELSKIPWIFGPEYISLDVRGAGETGIPDRRLKRIDGLSDILEIKLPSAELLRKDSHGRHYIAPDLSEALGQLTGYLEYYYSSYTTEYDDETGEEILDDRLGKYYKPKGILLIGRRKKQLIKGVKSTDNIEPKCLRRLMSYFHWVEVLTYDDLIERARNGLKNILEI